jgi:hypothetical protein
MIVSVAGDSFEQNRPEVPQPEKFARGSDEDHNQNGF